MTSILVAAGTLSWRLANVPLKLVFLVGGFRRHRSYTFPTAGLDDSKAQSLLDPLHTAQDKALEVRLASVVPQSDSSHLRRLHMTMLRLASAHATVSRCCTAASQAAAHRLASPCLTAFVQDKAAAARWLEALQVCQYANILLLRCAACLPVHAGLCCALRH
jgi:hypothetical protein